MGQGLVSLLLRKLANRRCLGDFVLEIYGLIIESRALHQPLVLVTLQHRDSDVQPPFIWTVMLRVRRQNKHFIVSGD